METSEAGTAPPTLARPSRTRAWISLGPAGELRPAVSFGAGAAIEAGARLDPGVWLGVAGRWLAPRTLPDVPDSGVDSSYDVAAGAWWSPDLPVSPWVGATFGVSTRGYTQGAREVDSFVVPVGVVELGATARLGQTYAVLLAARAGLDAADTEVIYGDSAAVPLPTWAFGARLSVRAIFP